MGILENNIRILRDNYAPLAAIPEDQLLRLIRTYELEPGDCISFNSEQEECIFVLSGEVEQSANGEESRLGPHNTLTRPICQVGSDSTFTAIQASVLGRINPARLDFLLSWESLRTDTRVDSSFHDWLGRLRNPLIF